MKTIMLIDLDNKDVKNELTFIVTNLGTYPKIKVFEYVENLQKTLQNKNG
jgi:hypothetical protein